MGPDELQAAIGYRRNFARLVTLDGMMAELAFDPTDPHWPWLQLPPHHPVLIEKYQYFSAMTASLAAGIIQPGVGSALTRFVWRCTDAALAGRHAVAASFRGWTRESAMGFDLTLADESGEPVCHTSGDGYSFTDRDFRSWRQKARQAAAAAEPQPAVALAAPEDCGLDADGFSFVSTASAAGDPPRVRAVVAAERAFHPRHPFHTGTGDHVNAGHLFDCALQAAHRFLPPIDGRWLCTGGEAAFRRFVELDQPFEIRWANADRPVSESPVIEMLVSQGGRENAEITLELQRQGPL